MRYITLLFIFSLLAACSDEQTANTKNENSTNDSAKSAPMRELEQEALDATRNSELGKQLLELSQDETSN